MQMNKVKRVKCKETLETFHRNVLHPSGKYRAVHFVDVQKEVIWYGNVKYGMIWYGTVWYCGLNIALCRVVG